MKKVLLKIALLTLALGLILPNYLGEFGQAVTGLTPASSDNEWILNINGEVDTPLSLSMTDLKALPKTVVYGELFCMGTLVSRGNWSGVKISTLLQRAGFNRDATNLEFQASDGYSMKVSLVVAVLSDYIVAYELDGQPLNEGLRLVLPDYPGDYWISMITQINVTFSEIYNIAPPDGAVLPPPTPPSEATPSPQPTPTPPTPTSTEQPTAESMPTIQPSEAPTASPTSNATPNVPSPTLPPQSPTSPPSTLSPTEPQSTPSSTVPPLGGQQAQPETSPKVGSGMDLGFAALVAVGVVVGAVACAAVVLLRKKSKT